MGQLSLHVRICFQHDSSARSILFVIPINLSEENLQTCSSFWGFFFIYFVIGCHLSSIIIFYFIPRAGPLMFYFCLSKKYSYNINTEIILQIKDLMLSIYIFVKNNNRAGRP